MFSDGLDLLAEFLACSRPAAGGIAVRYEDPAQWRAVIEADVNGVRIACIYLPNGPPSTSKINFECGTYHIPR